jgi:protein phosphatase
MNEFDMRTRVIRVRVAGRTHVGHRRTENQDTFLVVDLTRSESGGLLLEPDVETGASVIGEFDLGEKGALCLVADGMGGAAAGSLASAVAVACIHDELRKHWRSDRNSSPQQFATRLKEAVEASNARIYQVSQTDSQYKGMGTTATAVGMLDEFLYIAHVGDSRAYLVRNGVAGQITRDQSFTQQLIDAGTMTEEQAERSSQRNVILQAVGPAEVVYVDLTYHELRRGDIVIVCSDGLTKTAKRTELAELSSRLQDPALICDQLVNLANLRGGPDNVTVVAARFDGDGLQVPAEDDQIGRYAFGLEPR